MDRLTKYQDFTGLSMGLALIISKNPLQKRQVEHELGMGRLKEIDKMIDNLGINRAQTIIIPQSNRENYFGVEMLQKLLKKTNNAFVVSQFVSLYKEATKGWLHSDFLEFQLAVITRLLTYSSLRITASEDVSLWLEESETKNSQEFKKRQKQKEDEIEERLNDSDYIQSLLKGNY